MKKIFNCEIEYFKSPHLNQIYAGFDMLNKQGIINLKYKKKSGNHLKPIIKVIIDKKYTVLYDTLDGLNWTEGSLNENLAYFSKIEADFYFKRSYTEKLKSINNNLRIYPLGFNYFIDHNHIFNDSIKNVIKNSFFYKKLKPWKSTINSELLQKPIIKGKTNQIIFFSRLWSPETDSNLKNQEELNYINNSRINAIRKCKEEFGNIFIGGLLNDKYARKLAPDLISNPSQTNKINYLKNVEKSTICITTTGLHDSIGWKFGEYIANSKAIISEPLKYSVPGNFNSGKNYLEFNNENELVNNLNLLLKDNKLIDNMMKNNFDYYNEYLRPDKLILNSLLEIKNNVL